MLPKTYTPTPRLESAVGTREEVIKRLAELKPPSFTGPLEFFEIEEVVAAYDAFLLDVINVLSRGIQIADKF